MTVDYDQFGPQGLDIARKMRLHLRLGQMKKLQLAGTNPDEIKAILEKSVDAGTLAAVIAFVVAHPAVFKLIISILLAAW